MKAAKSVYDERDEPGLGVDGMLVILVDLDTSPVLDFGAGDLAAVGGGHAVHT